MRRFAAAALFTSSLLWMATLAGAQGEVPVRVQGRVMWISGQKLVVIPDGSVSINVDISQVPQEQLRFLREGDRVIVTGTVPNPRNRIVASTVEGLGQ